MIPIIPRKVEIKESKGYYDSKKTEKKSRFRNQRSAVIPKMPRKVAIEESKGCNDSKNAEKSRDSGIKGVL